MQAQKIFGCGIDVEEIDRFNKYFKDEAEIDPFFSLVFTDKEIENNTKINGKLCFPLGFSCKEAVFKALGMSWFNSPIDWKEIELLFVDKKDMKKYQLELSGFAKEMCTSNNIINIETDFDITREYINFIVIMHN